MNLYQSLVRPALFTLDGERAHRLSLFALRAGLAPGTGKPQRSLAVELAGLKFPGPIGLAAGYDKNGQAPGPLARLGFSHVEIGTVTPKPQPGNPKPRLFRLAADHAVINRMGFNNDGHAAVLARLGKQPSAGIVGVNIGANKDSADRIADYSLGLQTFWPVADYFTINISSPNTPGLRDLQSADNLKRLLAVLDDTRERLTAMTGTRRPMFLKVSPDLDRREIDAIAGAIEQMPPDGLVVSNTTLSRAKLPGGTHRDQAGGLSGRPLFERSTIVLARFRQRLDARFAIIGVGGIDSAETAWDKFAAGADLLQLYSGLVYHGPGLVSAINQDLAARLATEGLANISEITGTTTDDWAARDLP